MSEQAYVDLWDANVVTEEVIDIVWRITEGHFPGTPIDWDEVWERLDGDELEDGRMFNMDNADGTPALIGIKQEILRLRREL